ncbi:TPA: hypothetical protein LZQ72_004752, partial [Escherichia coli]|nr:hypothetical protein [Escherichia coli]EKD2467436.1 hypothetical protein [Escherichia coli]HBN6400765.1 hypothetical protein [Escherichia coli]
EPRLGLCPYYVGRITIVDARQFFSEHPEYISSAELEQKLYREFAQVTTVPAYKEMSMYQLLVISQDRLTH